jgi:hypothetical protein
MNTWLLRAAAVAMLLALPTFAAAQWSDNFDSYANGSGLHGQGGWMGWDCDPAWDALVTDLYSHSAPHSADIGFTSDITQEFAGVTSGEWVISGWVYVPGNSTGQQYFILLNTYYCGGSTDWDWSLQMLFDSGAGTVSTVEGGSSTAIINDQWVEVKVEINLDTNTQAVYYNGAMLDTMAWTSTGQLALECLDLFSNGGSSVYWDDCVLSDGGATAVEPSSWGSIKASFK